MSSHRRRRSFPLRVVLFILTALTVLLLLWLALRQDAPGKPVPTPIPTPVEPTVSPTAPPREVGWELTLVNPWNPLPDVYEPPELEWLPNGLLAVDKRCYAALEALLDGCREQGFTPLVSSAYRTWEEQEHLFANAMQGYLDQGCSQEEAETEAGKLVAVPGTSEHQLGLAVDLCDISNQWLDESQEDTPFQQWLMEHSWEYGFVLRYPNDRSAVTGILYEPWHYRYVGKEAAAEMYGANLCLEEYLERLGVEFRQE